MISLLYLMVYLFGEGNLPGMELAEDCDPNEMFEQIKNVKKVQRTVDLCFGNTESLAKFKEEVFSYTFKDKPNYNKLRGMLMQLREQERATKMMGVISKEMADIFLNLPLT